MSNDPQNSEAVKPARLKRRRRILLWGLGITVLVLLAIIISQQLWLWTIIPPDTAADTLRGTVDDLLASATTGLAKMRIGCRRGELDSLPALADSLRSTLVELRYLAETYQ